MRRMCCCDEEEDPVTACGAPFFAWLTANGYTGSAPATVEMVVSGNSCAFSGNNGTFNLPIIGQAAWGTSSNGSNLCAANPLIGALIGCFAGFVNIDFYYRHTLTVGTLSFALPVSPSTIFGTTHQIIHATFGTWTLTLP